MKRLLRFLGNTLVASQLSDYEGWRDRFLRDRLQPALWIAAIFASTMILYLMGEAVFNPKHFTVTSLYIGVAVELGLMSCLALHKTRLGQRYPGLLFLGFSWSLTVVVQVGLALTGKGQLPILSWTLAFLAQATLMPVRWPLHLASQLGLLLCHIGVNLIFNLTLVPPCELHGLYYLYLFWFCFICDLSVYWYESLQRNQFIMRQELESAYQKLEAAEAKYRSIFENAGEGIFQSTPEGHYITANPALARIYGYDSPEEVTAYFTDIEHQLYVEPNRRAEFIRQIEEQGRVSEFESQVYRKDGSVVWISENARAVRDSSGNLLYYEGLIEDITERKQAEEALRVFIHAVSHDLRNPVTGMLMVLKNLQKKREETISIPRSMLQRMIQGSDRQLSLINSLLEAHVSEVRGVILHCQPVNLRELTEAAIADLEPLLAENQATLTNQVATDLPEVNADPIQLWRVFGNLIVNALKHNPPGLNLQISAKVIEAEVVEKSDRIQSPILHPPSTLPHPRILCSIQDDGVGIPPEQCEQVFDLYVGGAQARHSLSLGLGLYLSRQIVTAHGGEIGVFSSLGSGATFWFTLPLASRNDLDRW
ncbi:MAG: PAS domain S-box protein [Actinomycetota bacterium]